MRAPRAVVLASLLLLAACAPPRAEPPRPTPRPTPLPTRLTASTPTPPPPTATAEPPRVERRVVTVGDLDPYRGLYATERDGLFVTTRNPRGRYYYRWDDRRWYALADRVWFNTVEDLLTVYPGRQAAP